MDSRSYNPTRLLLAFGLAAFVVAGLSIADMFVPRPYDGVVLEPDEHDELVVQEVVRGSGADKAGISKGDTILGIGREALVDGDHAARVLTRFRIGDKVPYFFRVHLTGKTREVEVRLGRRRVLDGHYLYSCALGFSFFLVGLFVLVRQPTLRASQVFFLLCGLFFVFLVCRMRPPSYSSVDTAILATGTVAFLLLPAAFLHFYLIFPRAAWLQTLGQQPAWRAAAGLWRRSWPALYGLPPLVFGATFLAARWQDARPKLIYGAPATNWWLLAVYMLLGLVALVANSRRLKNPREQRGMALVIFGSVFGLVPFLISSLVFPTVRHSGAFFLFGIMPLVLVPITFTYAIVRFQLLDIRVILRRSLLYTVTTALLTGLYAGGIAAFNALFRSSSFARSPYFPIVLALAIVLLFEPLRRRLQEVIDQYFFAERSRLQRAMVELGEAMTDQTDLQGVVEELVGRLPQILGLRFAALYLLRDDKLVRLAGPPDLPDKLPRLPELQRHLRRRASLTRFDQLGALPLRSREVARLVEELTEAGVEALGDLATPRRDLGMVLLSSKEGQTPMEPEEMELLQGILHQVSMALETSLLLDERTQQAELEREMEIAATIQARLLPDRLSFAQGWDVAAVCRPARIVGGDFFTQLPAPRNGSSAVVFGDVAGKSVSGALMMMAAHEALHSLAMTQPDPAELFGLTNRRVYGLGQRNFVALGYFCAHEDGESLCYLVAGQPPPLLRKLDGEVIELPLPEHRIPIGALPDGDYYPLKVTVRPGELVLGYSDGVTEARSPNGDLFGSERLQKVLGQFQGGPADLVKEVLQEVEAFSRGTLQYDDLTLVALSRQGESRT